MRNARYMLFKGYQLATKKAVKRLRGQLCKHETIAQHVVEEQIFLLSLMGRLFTHIRLGLTAREPQASLFNGEQILPYEIYVDYRGYFSFLGGRGLNINFPCLTHCSSNKNSETKEFQGLSLARADLEPSNKKNFVQSWRKKKYRAM